MSQFSIGVSDPGCVNVSYRFSYTLLNPLLPSPFALLALALQLRVPHIQALGFEDAPLMDDPSMAPYKSHYGITGRASFTPSSSKGAKVSL